MGAHLTLEECRSEGVDRVEVLTRLALSIRVAGLRRAALLLDRDARPLRERANRLGERVALVLHQEVDGAPRFLAPEAMEEAAVRVDVEAG